MSRLSKKKSPLEKLVEIQQNKNLPVKVTPKDRLSESNTRVITPTLVDEDPISQIPVGTTNPFDAKSLAISNSSLVVNFNLNVDAEAMDKAIEKSAEMAKKIAAGAAAMLGTALIVGSAPAQEEKPATKSRLSRPTVNLKPKVKVPKFKK